MHQLLQSKGFVRRVVEEVANFPAEGDQDQASPEIDVPVVQTESTPEQPTNEVSPPLACTETPRV